MLFKKLNCRAGVFEQAHIPFGRQVGLVIYFFVILYILHILFLFWMDCSIFLKCAL